MSLSKKLTEADLQRIKETVKQAEEKISGEIVPVIVDNSGTYREANLKSALIFSFVVFLAIVLLDRYVIDASHTLYYDPMFIFSVVTFSAILGYLLPNFSASIKRIFLSRAVLDEFTAQRAENAFLEEEVFNTTQRTGIMIFISFFEHEVIIMADKGISKVVEQKEWDAIVVEIISYIRRGQIVEAVELGVKRCGTLLLEKGFHKADDDVNELGDDLRVN